MKKRKLICVVTGYKGGNYGTKLQSTALCKFFELHGCEVLILEEFKCKSFLILHPTILLNRIMCKINRKKTRKFFDPSVYEISEKRNLRLKMYEADIYKPIRINKLSQWNNLKKCKSIFVVGSDIIWQPSFGPPGYYFLDFTYRSSLTKYSYATSIGANELPKKYYKLYRKYLNDFNGVSVREQKAADMLNAIVDIKVIQRIDPTLLHTPEFWNKFADKAQIPDKIKPGQFIFCYFVMDDKRYWEYVSKVVNSTGYTAAVLPMHHNDEKQPYHIITEGTPYEFLWLIKNAAFICTDSFHVCAFSLNYKKEFYLLRRSRKDEDAKYDDFFERYGLTDRTVTDESKFIRNKEIDFESAHLKLDEDRKTAYEYISSMLN